MKPSVFNDFAAWHEDESKLSQFRREMEAAGYFAFFSFVEDFRNHLKSYGDDAASETLALVLTARRLFPNPVMFSPSWEKVWDELELIVRAKNETLRQVAPDRREGEWQVLIDNPYLPQQVVCYPGLAFLDAAYMYAYFQYDLEPSELLRLQRIEQLLAVNSASNKSAIVASSTVS